MLLRPQMLLLLLSLPGAALLLLLALPQALLLALLVPDELLQWPVLAGAVLRVLLLRLPPPLL